MHGCTPRPSSPEFAGVEVVAAVEATVCARVDRASFVATLRRCAQSLEKLGAEMQLLGMLVGGGKEAMASLVAAVVRDAKEVF